MGWDEVLSNIEDKELSEQIKTAVESELSNRSAGIRAKAEAKAKAELEKTKSQVTEMEETLAALKAEHDDKGKDDPKNSELAKAMKELDQLKKKHAQEVDRATTLEKEKQGFIRNAGIEKLLGSFDFVSEQARGSGRILLENALKTVEDLGDEEAVKEVVKSFEENHPFLIAADTGGGTGSNNRFQTSNNNASDPDKMTDVERVKYLRAKHAQALYTGR